MSNKDWREWKLRTTKLTEHEKAVLALIAQGYSTAEVATEMKKDHTSITSALARTRRKLGARNSTHAAVIAVRNNLL